MTNLLSEEEINSLLDEHNEYEKVIDFHKNLINDLVDILSKLLKTDVNIKFNSIRKITAQLIEKKKYSSFNIFSFYPLNEKFILEFNYPINFIVIDRLLSGKGVNCIQNRAFSKIELSLIKFILDPICDILNKHYKNIDEKYLITLEDVLTTPKMVYREMVNFSFELSIGEEKGIFNFIYPLDIYKAFDISEREILQLEVILDYLYLKEDKLFGLQEGDILELNKNVNDLAIVTIDSKEKFLATLGSVKNKKSIKIVDYIGDSLNVK